MSIENKCLIKLTNDSLIVANTGQPFSRLGVISICASHRGTKRKEQPIDLFKEVRDSDLPKAIRDKEIETYLRDENRLLDDYNQEIEVGFDYGGRFFWELLQNADDAMCPVNTPPSDLIGIKGLGFKSVLEITDKPAIYSDPFHFYFAANDNDRLLQKRGISEPPPLTFRIPHDNPNIENIIDLVDEFPTIINLPFKDQAAQKKVEEKLINLSVFFLLLSQYVETVEVLWSDGRNRQWRIDRKNGGELKDGDISVEVIEGGRVKEVQRFRRWANIWSPEDVKKRHSVACCLPLGLTNEVQAWGETFPLYSFFPTEEFLPFRALFHASFDLDQSRKHVRDTHNENILEKFEMLVGRILYDIPADISLRAFHPKDKPNEDTVAHILWNRFESVLKKKNFVPCIGGKKVIPPEVRLWEYNLGNVLKTDEKEVIERFLVDPKLLRDEDLRDALDYLGAESLEKEHYFFLLGYCKNKNRDECQKTLKAFFTIIKNFPYPKTKSNLNICRKIPCWWIADSRARSLSDKLPFLRKKPELSLPDWLRFDVLDHEYLEFLKEIESQDDCEPPKIWNEILYGRLLNDTRDELLHNFLVPTIESKIEQNWWKKHGRDVLHFYQLWTQNIKYRESPIAIWNDNDRLKLGECLLLPTDKGWLPSWQCYAGKAWGAPKSFDSFFGDIKNRGVLKGPDQWPVNIDQNKEHWKKVLRYAGVSWEMKLICKRVPGYDKWKIEGKTGSWKIECPFQSLVQERDWNNYVNSLAPPSFKKGTQFEYDTKVHENWGIEYFPDALPDDLFYRLKVIKPIAKEAKDSRMEYSYQKGGGYAGRNNGQIKSFAAWQIENFSWMPCKKSLLDDRLAVPPDKAYMPGKGIGGLLPEINIRMPDGQEGRDIATFLTQTLGVREILPIAGEIIWKEWIEKLPDAAQRTTDHGVAIKATRMLYKNFFEIHDERPKWFDEILDIPCLEWDMENKSEQLRFYKSSKIYWLDKSYLAEPKTRIELLQRVNIFILEQEQGQKASDLYAIKPLSKIVHVKPQFNTKDQDTTLIIQKRYEKRFNSLKVASGSTNLPKPENLKIRAVESLRLKIIKEEEVVAEPKVRNWKEDGLTLLDSSSKWEALGLALAQGQTRKGLSNLFENLLRARDMDEVFQRLRDLGVPEAAIDDLESDFQKPVPTDTNEAPNTELTERKKSDEDIENSVDQDATQEPESEQEHSSGPTDTRVNGKKGKGKTNSGGVSQSRHEKGKDAEKWIRSAITNLLRPTDWEVSNQPERDHLNRESDIVLSHPKFREYHIEVKHVEAGEIFWSEREVCKAKAHKGKYWMVVARPKYRERNQDIIWIWDPLEDLINLPRHGRWLWRGETDDLDAEISDWDVPFPRKKQDAASFVFVVKVSNHFFDNHCPSTPKGLNRLKERLISIK